MIFDKLIKILWGELHGKELLKFGLLSLGFFFLIGSYWPLKTLKDSVFINIVGPAYLPLVKILSLALFFPIVLLYSKLVDIWSKEKIIYSVVLIYGVLGFVIVYFLGHPTIGVANTVPGANRLLGWFLYVFVESFISLMVSLYWSFINDITTPESAKKGYGMIAFGTQLGGFLFTLFGNYLAYDETKYTTTVPKIALISVLMFFLIALVVFIVEKVTPRNELESYGHLVKPETKERVGFWDGLQIILTRPYVLGIFGIIFFQEFVTTILGLQMSLLAKFTYADPGLLNKFYFNFSMWVQIIACLFALLGTSYFQRRFGIKFCLVTFPLLLGGVIIGYVIHPTLATITYVMLIAKSLNYALNQPAKEVLYIPTTKSVKFKSKAWIDMFGMRFGKASGSSVSNLFGGVVGLTGGVTLCSIFVWVIVSTVVGNMFKKVVDNREIIE
ncbi:MAG: Plastidic atp adp transporter [candidate division TM6 bacterium GW2011_GWF2_37_49]|nr:MAG: Plastidic atp adp transporter [candidate division TM6 bacterium GW2011_GWF2_37_49]